MQKYSTTTWLTILYGVWLRPPPAGEESEERRLSGDWSGFLSFEVYFFFSLAFFSLSFLAAVLLQTDFTWPFWPQLSHLTLCQTFVQSKMMWLAPQWKHPTFAGSNQLSGRVPPGE